MGGSSGAGASSASSSASAFALALSAAMPCFTNFFVRFLSSLSRPAFVPSFVPASLMVFIILTMANTTIAIRMKSSTACMSVPQFITSEFSISSTRLPMPSSMYTPLSTVHSDEMPFSSPPTAQFMSGIIMSFVRLVTIAVNAAPITTPTARSITLPRVINFLNSAQSFLIAFIECFPACQISSFASASISAAFSAENAARIFTVFSM